MRHAPAKPMKLDRQHRIAMAIAGTVGLPSPFPATGRVVLQAEFGPRKSSGKVRAREADLFLKSVQVISDRNIVTRLVELDAVRAIGYFRKNPDENGGEQWVIVPVRCDDGPIAEAIEKIRGLDSETAEETCEVPLFDKAVLYVPENAAVLHRQEFGLTAAVSVEATEMLSDFGFSAPKHCCG